MSRDRRGFRFALQPVYIATQWEIDAIRMQNADLRRALTQHEKKRDDLAAEIVQVGTDVLARQNCDGLVDIDVRRRAFSYLDLLRQRQASMDTELAAARQACEEGEARLRTARQFAEGLERHRDAALVEHDDTVARQAYQAASDDWLQRRQWKDRR